MNQTLRLIFPQWQGGESTNIANYVNELTPEEAAQGYYLGAQLLQWLAPATNAPTATVPVSLDRADTATENGIFAYAPLVRQLRSALDLIRVHAPRKIVTLGGECAVSVAPFAYLAAQYPDDLAVIWLDAHPDLRVPFEDYSGFHAMALTALLGKGDADIIAQLPAQIAPERALIVGLRSPEGIDMQRPERYGVRAMPSEKLNDGGAEILDWLKQSSARRVAIHLDLDGLDPRDLAVAVAREPDGLRLDAVIEVIQKIAAHSDLVGLTIAEPMLREAIKLRRLLHSLPLLAE